MAVQNPWSVAHVEKNLHRVLAHGVCIGYINQVGAEAWRIVRRGGKPGADTRTYESMCMAARRIYSRKGAWARSVSA